MDIDFQVDFDDTAAGQLRDYVGRVNAALGLRGDSSFVDAGRPANAYVALDGRVPGFRDDDVALLWNERSGWSVAVENPTSGELLVVARLDGDVRPTPSRVARWVAEVVRRDGVTVPMQRTA